MPDAVFVWTVGDVVGVVAITLLVAAYLCYLVACGLDALWSRWKRRGKAQP